MNQEEAIIVAAHTGCFLPNLDIREFHKFAEDKFERRLTPEDMEDRELWQKLRDETKEDFEAILVHTKHKKRRIQSEGLGFNKENLK